MYSAARYLGRHGQEPLVAKLDHPSLVVEHLRGLIDKGQLDPVPAFTGPSNLEPTNARWIVAMPSIDLQ